MECTVCSARNRRFWTNLNMPLITVGECTVHRPCAAELASVLADGDAPDPAEVS